MTWERRRTEPQYSRAGNGGVGFGGALLITFVVLKLTGYVDWSWWWVMTPLWAPIVVVLGVVLAGAVVWLAVTGVSAAWSAWARRQRRRKRQRSLREAAAARRPHMANRSVSMHWCARHQRVHSGEDFGVFCRSDEAERQRLRWRPWRRP